MDDARLAWLTQPTRSRILDAAEQHFAVEGFAASRVDAIAATAGVSKSHLYYHFDSKDTLLACLIELRTAQLLADKDGLLGEPVAELVADPARLADFIAALLRVLVARRSFVRVVLVESISNPAATRPVVSALNAVLDDSLSRFSTLGQAGNTEALRRRLFFFGLLPALYAVAADERLGLPGDLTELAGDFAELEAVVLPGHFTREG